MLEMIVQHMRAEILLHRGDQMTRVHGIAWSHDTNGNVMDKAHANPFLDTKLYQVKFTGGRLQS